MKSILIVDDDIINLSVAENALEEAYHVIAVTSGMQALKFLEKNTCDLILLDINMPEMDGFCTMQKIREEYRCQTPIIFLTADNDPDTEKHCLEEGAVDYIVKPFVVKVLCSRISRTLELEELRQNLQKKVEEKTAHIELLSDHIVQALAHTIDAKDRYTSGHSTRVAEYAKKIAARMGKNREEQEAIYRAGLLHDVGKIRVPEEIINKAARLTEEEFEMIKLHPITGYHILKEISVDNIFSDGARFHHERYDGKGYPNGLSGEQIPEIARIVGVADAYDAMTSNRSYRTALDQSIVRREFERGKGTQFDPVIADIMLQIMEEDTQYCLRETAARQKKILVVDDEPFNQSLVEIVLQETDLYVSKGAESGAEALEILKQEKFDLVLLDVKMPGMDGYETAARIREFSDIPIVLITADRQSLDMRDLRERRIADFITRPFRPAYLMEILHAVLG